MQELTDEKREEISQLFKKYDKDDNDSIDWDEFRNLIDELIGDIPLQEKARIFDVVDTNHSGRITFDEFIDWWANR